MQKAKVINLYRHNIIHYNIKHKDKRMFFFALSMCAICVFCFSYLYFVNDVVCSSVSSVNPINELYRDMEVASFVNGGVQNFVVPVKTEKYTIENNIIKFEIDSSIMVYATSSGVIESITGDTSKTIKIKHADNYYSVVSNVDIVGVKVNESVKQGKEIATAKAGTIIEFYIMHGDKIQDEIYLNKSFIKWNQK